MDRSYTSIQRKANRSHIKGDLDRLGTKNPNYKQGRWICKTHGYVHLTCKYSCPYSNERGRVREHIFVWWEKYKDTKPILNNEVVHHINQNKTDNRIENLKKMTLAEHTKLHNKLDLRRSKIFK